MFGEMIIIYIVPCI